MYSARLTRHKPEIKDTKEHARLYTVDWLDSFAKSMSCYEKPY
jgi:hypothetical protein